MRLILTRPRADSLQLAEKLKALGHDPLICPLLAIEPLSHDAPQAHYQAVIATSANGFIAAENLNHLHHLPVYTVGPQSQAKARAQGFHQVEAQGGDVIKLSHYLRQQLKPENGPLLYLAGTEISSDFKALMEEAGFSVEKLIRYHAVPQKIANLPEILRQAEAVLLYSPRTAKLWRSEVKAHGLERQAAHLRYFCLSPAIAQLLDASWPVTIAPAPHEGALLSQLDHMP